MAQERITVHVGGKDFAVTSPDGAAHVQRVAAYADRTLREVMNATRLPLQSAAVLTLINLTDDLMKAQDECSRLRRQLEELRAKA